MAGKKTTIDGIIFDSKLEADCYIKLRDSGIPFKRQPEFTLYDSFNYMDMYDKKRKYSAIRYTPDFIVDMKQYHLAIEIKGRSTGEYRLRKKIWLRLYRDTHRFVEINTLKEMDSLISKLQDTIENKENNNE